MGKGYKQAIHIRKTQMVNKHMKVFSLVIRKMQIDTKVYHFT